LGVSGGAAIGGTVAIAFNLDTAIGNSMVLAIAFAGALFATHIVFLLSRRQSRVDPYRLLLVGIVFNLFATSVIMFIKSIVSALKAQEILFWLLGSLAIERMDYTKLLYLAVFFIMGAIILIQMSPALNALSLGEAEANNLGYPVERVKTRIFIASSLIIGAVVSVSGLIGFVGLIIPHAMRLIIGPDHRLLMVASAFAGAAFLMFTDTVTRLLFRVFDTELPVGVLTAFIGGPIFVYLLQRSRKEKL
jgi:iron complex transport system permease protein